jgi:uncharacterized protein YecT (DUF1311 family)
MKNKVAVVIMTAILIISLEGCALFSLFSQNGSSVSSEAESSAISSAAVISSTPAPSPSASSSSSEQSSSASSSKSTESEAPAASKTAAPEPSEDPSSGNLPDVDGSDAFRQAFANNAIDTKYISDLQTATTVSEMVKVTNKASDNWEAQMNKAYDEIMEIYQNNESKSDDIKMEQAAWNNDLPIAIQEIKDGTDSEGTMSNVVIAYKTMLLYRTRAAVLLNDIYEENGTVNVEILIGEAVG